MAPHPWLSGQDECQGCSTHCTKVLQITQRQFESMLVNSAREGVLLLTCLKSLVLRTWQKQRKLLASWNYPSGHQGGAHRLLLGSTQHPATRYTNSAEQQGEAASWCNHPAPRANCAPPALGGQATADRVWRTTKEHHVSVHSSSLEPAVPSQNSHFNLLGPFFPF